VAVSARDPSAGPDQSGQDARLFQQHHLDGVSRTFAFTIPQLPAGLRETVTNAYLLCRIADTIEDDPGLDADAKDSFHVRFIEAASNGKAVESFSRDLDEALVPTTVQAERDLIRDCPRVLGVTRDMADRPRRAVLDCLSTMSRGMAKYARNQSPRGLTNIAECEDYCYYVAGVVGEMLTEIFCDHSPEIDARRADLEQRSVDFGLGLQMTNILKDIRDDHRHGVCWLPREVFARYGYDLDRLGQDLGDDGPAFSSGVRDLVAVAHAHLRRALEYTLAIDRSEVGVRRFLIWATLLATSTLRKISAQPLFQSGQEVKVSRRRVAAIVALSNTVIRSNFGLSALFNASAIGLPLGPQVSSGPHRKGS
jgi:farnesyl-diphosphate farnesyltransferase